MEAFVIVLICVVVLIVAFVAIAVLITRRPNKKRWYPANKPPDSGRNVAIIVDGDERFGWYVLGGSWVMYPLGSYDPYDNMPCIPTKWRELTGGETVPHIATYYKRKANK